jgi:chorismate lyase / 3-hydroxybenzoate synthase
LPAHDLTDPALPAPSVSHGDTTGRSAKEYSPQIRVEHLPPGAPLPSGLLAVVRFGTPGTAGLQAGAPLQIDVQLAPLRASAPCVELWYGTGPVRTGRSGLVRYACDDHFLFAAIEEDERTRGGILPTAEAVYADIRRFQEQSPYPHLLRIWNYLDAINEGDGDLERYREFCVGRARGLSSAAVESYPAATAVGRKSTTHQLQVFWLASRQPGTAVENPRQVSAYRYPRDHGPVSPSFSRATLTADGTVLISGTASIVGHVSQHDEQPLEQLEETLRNLTALRQQAGQSQAPGAQDLLKVYVRDPAWLEPVAARLDRLYPGNDVIYLAADICRRELLLEVESVRRSDGAA